MLRWPAIAVFGQARRGGIFAQTEPTAVPQRRRSLGRGFIEHRQAEESARSSWGGRALGLPLASRAVHVGGMAKVIGRDGCAQSTKRLSNERRCRMPMAA